MKKQLEKSAQSSRRSKSVLAPEAIREYLAVNKWHIKEIKKAIQEADRGEFASGREVQIVMSNWTKHDC
jgi:RHH-type rel operon transcriptional repressor/antitoxin RelB